MHYGSNQLERLLKELETIKTFKQPKKKSQLKTQISSLRRELENSFLEIKNDLMDKQEKGIKQIFCDISHYKEKVGLMNGLLECNQMVVEECLHFIDLKYTLKEEYGNKENEESYCADDSADSVRSNGTQYFKESCSEIFNSSEKRTRKEITAVVEADITVKENETETVKDEITQSQADNETSKESETMKEELNESETEIETIKESTAVVKENESTAVVRENENENETVRENETVNENENETVRENENETKTKKENEDKLKCKIRNLTGEICSMTTQRMNHLMEYTNLRLLTNKTVDLSELDTLKSKLNEIVSTAFIDTIMVNDVENDEKVLELLSESVIKLENYENDDFLKLSVQFGLAKLYVKDIIRLKRCKYLNKV